MAAPNNRQMNACKDGKHRHLRPQITGYTSKLRKKELRDTLQRHGNNFGPLRGCTPPAARPLSKAQQYRKEHADLRALEAGSRRGARRTQKYDINEVRAGTGGAPGLWRLHEPTPISTPWRGTPGSCAEKDRKRRSGSMVRARAGTKRPLSAP